MVLAVFFVLVIFRLNIPFVGWIAGMFNKDVTFTGRVYLWDAAFKAIKENPIFGVGDNYKVLRKIYTLWWQELAYSHNEILDVIVRTGYVGLFLYLNIIRRTILDIRSGFRQIDVRIVLYTLVSFWVMMMLESYSNYSFYFLYYMLLILPGYMLKNYKVRRSV
jgi:O-antigen ligase